MEVTNKRFLPVWDVTPGTNELNNLSNDTLNELLETNIDIEPMFLWLETTKYKIYYCKINENEVSPNKIRYFFGKIESKNFSDKQLIFINPTETVSSDFKEYYPNADKAIMVTPDKWQGIGTFLYTKSMFDGVYTAYSTKKYENILEQNYKPFDLVYLVRRGHDRRYEFFKYLQSKNNKKLYLTYKNTDLTAKGFDNENQHLNFFEKDGIEFPYQSHSVIQPIDYHAAFQGNQFMFQNLCLLTMAKFNLVVESNSYRGALTEKSMFPFLAKTIPILTNGETHINMLENMGYYTFVDELGIRDILKDNIHYSPNGDNTEYFNRYFNVLDKLVNGDFDYIYETMYDKVEYNYNLSLEIQNGTFLNN
jgi:hypothetical protein